MSVLPGARSGVEWLDLFDPRESGRTPPSAVSLKEWLVDFLTLPNEELGRDGPVCPYVKPSVGHHKLWTGFVRGELTAERTQSVIDDALDLFSSLMRPAGTHSVQPALIAVFENVTDYAVIDGAHARYKDRFVADGMMLGQFYPGCSQPGLWSENFRPLDAPLPMLVVRNMMPSDYPFLVGKSEWLFSYLSRFGRALPVRLRRSIAESLFEAVGGTAGAITDHRIHGVEDIDAWASAGRAPADVQVSRTASER
ncbi:DUF6875 domain-containing protein [Nocardia beijingensis]|uniref:DUF6875 domain-containing protein n=1 Tax=Nocardia beijingensis TaxID=95162 RepID=UPI002B4ABCDC|nr:hypothetical protein [Nocardia beijingensis]